MRKNLRNDRKNKRKNFTALTKDKKANNTKNQDKESNQNKAKATSKGFKNVKKKKEKFKIKKFFSKR